MNKIVAIVGMAGSGKSVLADKLVEAGFTFIRFGQITLDIVKERGLEPTEDNEKKAREEVRRKCGMGAYAILNMPKIKEALKKGNVVVDNLLSWSEYKILRQEYGDKLVVVAVYSPPELRYKRLTERKLLPSDKSIRNRPATFEDAKKRDYNEIENIEKGGPIVMADFTLQNIGTMKDFEKQIAKLINKVL
ncbi:MAG TPA: AAA family ATPase [archaeon]|nr:AAA family ATPase [archaeon]